MKRFLTLLFALSAYLANGQDYRRIVIAPPSGSSGAYEVRAPRNLSTYPLTTSGTSSYTAALASGAFSLTVINTGCVIASGTPPPVSAPTCTPVETAPSWITGLRYSHDGTTMTVLASGDVSSIAFNTNPVTSWSIPNPNNVLITNGVFYGHAPDAVNGFYSWQINKPAGAFTLTLKNSSGSTYSKNFSATTGANNVVLIGTTTDPPTSTSTAAPSFANAFRYSYSGSTLTVEIDGSVGDLSFNTVPSTSTTWGNPDNINIVAGQFYGYGEHLENAPFSKRWQVNLPAGSNYSLTARQAGNTSNTFTTTLKPLSGASNVVFVGSGSTNPTNPPTTTVTYRPISKVLIESNSIGFYPTNVGFGWSGNWGAAASSADKDFYHILSDSIHTIYPNADVRLWGTHNELGISLAEGGYFEQFYDNLGDGLHRYDTLSQYAPDVLITRLGENVTDVRGTFQTSWKNQIDRVTIKSSNPLKIITTSVWGNSTVDNALIALATNNNWPWVDLRNIAGSRDGTVGHPTDAAHAEYAKRIWAKMKTSLATSTTTTTPPSTTTAVAGSVDSQGFLVYDDQGWSGADIKRIENNEMFLEFKRSVGACVTAAGLKSNNRNVVNDEQVRPDGGPQISDKGVQWQVSPYTWPAGNQDLTIGTETRGGTGDNPVQGGSANPYFQPGKIDKSAIINTPDRGPVFCARVRGALWDWFFVPGHMPVDIEWWFLPGKVIKYKVRLTVEPRPSNWSGTQRFQSLSQEMLCLYNIGAFNTHVAQVNGNEISLRDGIPLDGQSNDYFTSGCWAATYQPDRQQGVLYYTPRNAIFKSWQKRGEQGEWMDNSMSYINASLKRTYDIAGTQTIDDGYIILGSQSEAMARMAQLEPIDQSYDFDFTSLNNQWWNEDARVMRASNGALRYYCGDEKTDNGQTNTFGRFLSPARAWQTSQFKNVEFDMAVTGVNRLLLKWGKPGRFGQYEYSKEITVNGDGVRRTYQFKLDDMPNWDGTVTYLGLQATVPGQPSAYIDMYRARKFGNEGLGEFLLLSLAAGTALARRKKATPVRIQKLQKSTSRLRLGVGSLASLVLAVALFSCHTPRQIPTKPVGRVLIFDGGAISSDFGQPATWSMYDSPEGKKLLESDSLTNYDPIHSGPVPDSLRHKDH